jgi:hypothetical protein
LPTGISKFARLGVFSKLNNLTDISMNDKYAALCGITRDELLPMGSIRRSTLHFIAHFTGALLLLASCADHPVGQSASIEENFKNPPQEAKPWVFWYWMNAAISHEGITADLEAMRQAGIGGAYLTPIQWPKNLPIVEPPVEPLSPEWWERVRHAMREADRLGLKIAMHDGDGFALPGDPWITPELSRQKLTWTRRTVAGEQAFCDTLPQPETNNGYYKDIAVYAFPSPEGAEQAPDTVYVTLDKIINLTSRFKNGLLTWSVPAGRWAILRMGHTSTGHANATGGAGAGPKCDMLSKKATRLQLDSRLGEAIRQVGTELSGRTLKGFHIDAWECGSQSWSPVLRSEFKRRRGYDMLPYLPAMTGLPVESADFSERFLHDVRQTVAELVVDNFYATMQKNAHKFGCFFSAKCVAPDTVSDGMALYQNVDIPMGEFWLNSSTHGKPSDMLDAISGAHIYGKNIVQAKSFTQLRVGWNEHPEMLKLLGDRAYAAGINRLAYNVFAHNPFVDKQPGMTLSEASLYFQRDQTWWELGRTWVEYAQRCQALLQHGRPVTDIAVFTGDEVPARAALPERLTTTLPGIVGREMVESEALRLANAGALSSANAADPAKYVDMLRGYKYDSFNRDALLRLARVERGRIVLPGGASYAMLVLPRSNPLAPNADRMSVEVAARLLSLIKEGATVLVEAAPTQAHGLADAEKNDNIVRRIAAQIWGEPFAEEVDDVLGRIYIKNLGRGRVAKLPYYADSFFQLGLERDAAISENGKYASQVAWTHRASDSVDVYFISNQKNEKRTLTLALRTTGASPELWDAVTGSIFTNVAYEQRNSHTVLQACLPENGSVFVVLRKKAGKAAGSGQRKSVEGSINIFSPSFAPKPLLALDGAWQVSFDKKQVGESNVAVFPTLESWTSNSNPKIRRYSGTACYTQTFTWSAPSEQPKQLWLDLGRVANLAEVTLNGQPCGVAWTAPYRVDITGALREGSNTLSVEVASTWANRLLYEYALPENRRSAWAITTIKQHGNQKLREAGLLGEVKILGEL